MSLAVTGPPLHRLPLHKDFGRLHPLQVRLCAPALRLFHSPARRVLLGARREIARETRLGASALEGPQRGRRLYSTSSTYHSRSLLYVSRYIVFPIAAKLLKRTTRSLSTCSVQTVFITNVVSSRFSRSLDFSCSGVVHVRAPLCLMPCVCMTSAETDLRRAHGFRTWTILPKCVALCRIIDGGRISLQQHPRLPCELEEIKQWKEIALHYLLGTNMQPG